MKVIVIGGGIAGLAAAHRVMELAREKGAPLDLQVLEASPRPGGIVRTMHEGSFLLEEGPDSFITDKPWALDLARRLALDRELLPTNPGRKSHVWWGGKLHPIPDGFYVMAPGKLKPILSSTLFSVDGKARISMERLVPVRKSKDDESVGAFVRRRMGAEALERLVQPLVSGIYGGDVDQIGMQGLFAKFVDMEQTHGSLSAAMRSAEKPPIPEDGVSGARYSLFMTLRNGMGSLVDALLAALPKDSVLVNASVQSLERVSGRWDVTLDTGYKTSADGVIVALPAPKAARLLRAVDGGMADALGAVKYAASAAVYFSYPWSALGNVPETFGFVVPAAEKKSILGCTFASAKFQNRAPKDMALLRAFIAPTHLDMDEEELLPIVERDVQSMLGIQGSTLFTAFKRHGPVMPQYSVGHAEKMSALDWRVKIIPRLTLAGNAYRGVGLPDCVKNAEDAAALLLEKLSQPAST